MDYIVSKYQSNLYIPNVICIGMIMIAFVSFFFIKGFILNKKENLIRLNKDVTEIKENVNVQS